MQPEAIAELREKFEGNVTEEAIDFRVEGLTDEGIGEMMKWFTEQGMAWGKLTEIDLGNNDITEVTNLNKLLEKATHAVDVDLRENGFGKDKMQIYKFQDGLRSMKSVTSLSLIGCQLWDYGCEVVCANAAVLKILRKLHLVDNFLSAASGPHIAKLIAKNTNIQELYLDYNKLHDDGIAPICEALPKNSNLKVLGLGDNGITDAGCEHLRDYLKQSRGGVKMIDLSVNDIEVAGCRLLSDGLAMNKTLVALDMGANRNMTDEGAVELTKFLKTNTCLRKLDLTNVDMTDEAAPGILENLTPNKTLTDLTMLLNEEMAMENKEKIARIFVANRELRQDQLDAIPDGKNKKDAVKLALILLIITLCAVTWYSMQ